MFAGRESIFSLRLGPASVRTMKMQMGDFCRSSCNRCAPDAGAKSTVGCRQLLLLALASTSSGGNTRARQAGRPAGRLSE